MAHTNETANYDLSQFIGTDIPNPLTDYNGDMLKIDTALGSIATSATAYEARVTALETQNGSVTLETTAQTLSGAVNEVNDDVADLTSRMTVAEGKITADESTLATAVTNISTVAGKVSAIETQNGSAVLTTTAQTLSGAVNELDSVDSAIDARVTALETKSSIIEPDTDNLITTLTGSTTTQTYTATEDCILCGTVASNSESGSCGIRVVDGGGNILYSPCVFSNNVSELDFYMSVYLPIKSGTIITYKSATANPIYVYGIK